MNFFTILLSNDDDNTITQLINEQKKEVEIFHLNQNRDEINKNSIFLICIGGDKGKSNTWWLKDGNDISNKGLKFIATLIELPKQYDSNDNKNFKIKVRIEYNFIRAIKREEFVYWPDSFDTDASVATKGKQTQAIAYLREDYKYLSLLCGTMYYDNAVEKVYQKLFGDEFLNKIKAPKRRFIEKNLSFEEERNLPKTSTESIQAKKSYTSPSQIIYYGVPGSGKSHKIDEEIKSIPNTQKMRVVFHPDYSNADFVGQILPVMLDDGVEYRFKAGPFSRILKRALKNPSEPHYLIIEEINRGNAAAIFGDLFQLLDRSESGWSNYQIENLDLNAFIRSSDNTYSDKKITTPTVKIGNDNWDENTGIRLPPNLSILATMNTSDQNVFTLDNAFQRRWDMQLVKNEFTSNDGEEGKQRNAIIESLNPQITWETFQTAINEKIGATSSEMGLSSLEDKRLGCWFVKNKNGKISKDVFANKVLKYLWDDAFKFSRDKIFENCSNFEELRNKFEQKGLEVFTQDLQNEFHKNKDSETSSE